MAKELPYFQFEPAEYMVGSIQFCSLEAQGLFVNIQCIYWQRNCELTIDQINKRFHRPDLLNELIENKIIKVSLENIQINFLKRSFKKHATIVVKNSINGKKSAEKRRLKVKPTLDLNHVNDRSTTVTDSFQPKFNETSTNRREEIIEDKIVCTHPLCLWIKDTLPNVSKMKTQLTDHEAERLVKKFNKNLIRDVLDAMDNKAGLTKKYLNVNKTIQSWIKIRLEKNPELGRVEIIPDYAKMNDFYDTLQKVK